MSISFKSVGHAFATFFKAVGKGAAKVVEGIEKVEGTEAVVEGTTAAVLGALDPSAVPVALSIEDAGYALLGEVVAAINAGGAAVEAKLADAGLDKNVIATVKAVGAGASQISALLSAKVK